MWLAVKGFALFKHCALHFASSFHMNVNGALSAVCAWSLHALLLMAIPFPRLVPFRPGLAV